MTSWHGKTFHIIGTLPVTGGTTERINDAELCFFHCYHPEQTAKQSAELQVIRDAMTRSMWPHNNEICIQFFVVILWVHWNSCDTFTHISPTGSIKQPWRIWLKSFSTWPQLVPAIYISYMMHSITLSCLFLTHVILYKIFTMWSQFD